MLTQNIQLTPHSREAGQDLGKGSETKKKQITHIRKQSWISSWRSVWYDYCPKLDINETQAIQNKCTKIKSLENGIYKASNCRGLMKRRQNCLKVRSLLSKLLESDMICVWTFTECSLEYRRFKGLRFLASSRLNASNCHDHKISTIPNVLTTTNVRTSPLFCMTNR